MDVIGTLIVVSGLLLLFESFTDAGNRWPGQTQRWLAKNNVPYPRKGFSLTSGYITRPQKNRYSRVYTSDGFTFPYRKYYSAYFYRSESVGYLNRRRPEDDILVCVNYEANANGTVMGVFSCPNTWEPRDYKNCCGYHYAEFCCPESGQYSVGSIIGISVGGLILLGSVVFIIYVIKVCVDKRSESESWSVPTVTHRTVPPSYRRPVRDPPASLLPRPATADTSYRPVSTDPTQTDSEHHDQHSASTYTAAVARNPNPNTSNDRSSNGVRPRYGMPTRDPPQSSVQPPGPRYGRPSWDPPQRSPVARQGPADASHRPQSTRLSASHIEPECDEELSPPTYEMATSGNSGLNTYSEEPPRAVRPRRGRPARDPPQRSVPRSDTAGAPYRPVSTSQASDDQEELSPPTYKMATERKPTPATSSDDTHSRPVTPSFLFTTSV